MTRTTTPKPDELPDALTVLAAVLTAHGVTTVSDDDIAVAEDRAVMFWRDDRGNLSLQSVAKP